MDYKHGWRAHITVPNIKKLLAYFGAVSLTLLASIFTLWFLTAKVPDRITMVWGVFRLLDGLPLLLSAGLWIYCLDNIVTTTKPGWCTAAGAGLAVMTDFASLIWFILSKNACKVFFSCLNKEDDPRGCFTVDPLCSISQFDVATGFYLVATIALLLTNTAYMLLIGGMMIYLPNIETYSEEGPKTVTEATPRANPVVRGTYYQYTATFAQMGCAVLAAEFVVIAPPSMMKFSLLVHIFSGYQIIQVFTSYDKVTQNKLACLAQTIFCGLSFLFGFLPSALYTYWNCVNHAPTRTFPKIDTCDLTINGGIYLLFLHASFIGIGGFRILLYVRTISKMRQPFVTAEVNTYAQSKMERRNLDPLQNKGNTINQYTKLQHRKPIQNGTPVFEDDYVDLDYDISEDVNT